MSLASSKSNYIQAEKLYNKINQLYIDIEYDNIAEYNLMPMLNNVPRDINKVLSLIQAVNISDFEGHYDQRIIDDIQHNKMVYPIELDWLRKAFMRRSLVDPLIRKLKVYLDKIPDYKIKSLGDDIKDVSSSMANFLLHTDFIDIHLNEIKRIIAGTMADKSFRKLFDSVESSLRARYENRKKRAKFVSYNKYKNNDEA